MRYRYEVVRTFGEGGCIFHEAGFINDHHAIAYVKSIGPGWNIWAVLDTEARPWWKIWDPGKIIYMEEDGVPSKSFRGKK